MTRICALVAALTSAAAVLVAGPASSVARPAASSWPQTDGNAALSRANLAETRLKPGNARRIKLLRTVPSPPFPPIENCVIGATPAVLDGGAAYSVLGGQVSRVDARTGAVRWATPVGAGDDTWVLDLAVADGIVVVDLVSCHSESDPTRTVQAFDARTGSPRWTAHAAGFGNMVVAQRRVVLMGGTVTGVGIRVLRLGDGTEAWSKEFGCLAQARAAVVHGLVTYGECDDSGTGVVDTYVEADRLRTGTKVWARSGFTQVGAGDLDTRSGRNLLVLGNGAVTNLDPATGRTRYTLAGATKILAVGRKRVFATCSGGAICGYRLHTGALIWQRTFASGSTSAALANGVLYLSNGPAVRAATGTRLAEFLPSAADGSVGPLAVGDGRVVAAVQPANSDPGYLAIYGLPGS